MRRRGCFCADSGAVDSGFGTAAARGNAWKKLPTQPTSAPATAAKDARETLRRTPHEAIPQLDVVDLNYSTWRKAADALKEAALKEEGRTGKPSNQKVAAYFLSTQVPSGVRPEMNEALLRSAPRGTVAFDAGHSAVHERRRIGGLTPGDGQLNIIADCGMTAVKVGDGSGTLGTATCETIGYSIKSSPASDWNLGALPNNVRKNRGMVDGLLFAARTWGLTEVREYYNSGSGRAFPFY